MLFSFKFSFGGYNITPLANVSTALLAYAFCIQFSTRNQRNNHLTHLTIPLAHPVLASEFLAHLTIPPNSHPRAHGEKKGAGKGLGFQKVEAATSTV